MATLKISVSLSGRDAATLARYQAARDQRVMLARVSELFAAISGGAQRPATIGITVAESGTRATGTVTCVTVANNSTVTIGNVVLTGKTAAPSGQAQFLCGVSATADAAALAAIINAHTTLSTWISATSALGVVTITVLDYDTRGNAYQLSSSDGTNLAVVGFSGGVTDASALSVAI